MPSASEDFIACYFDKYVSDESARFMLGSMKWQRRFFVFSGAAGRTRMRAHVHACMSLPVWFSRSPCKSHGNCMGKLAWAAKAFH